MARCSICKEAKHVRAATLWPSIKIQECKACHLRTQIAGACLCAWCTAEEARNPEWKRAAEITRRVWDL